MRIGASTHGGIDVTGCRASGPDDRRVYRLELTLQRLGLTRALLILGDAIPPPAAAMGDDIEAARHLRIVPIAPIKVLERGDRR